jgi:hypothetical protein
MAYIASFPADHANPSTAPAHTLVKALETFMFPIIQAGILEMGERVSCYFQYFHEVNLGRCRNETRNHK